MSEFITLLQQFGFPVALAVFLVYYWRRDYDSLVKRLRQVEEKRTDEMREYANSYQNLAERVTEALEQHTRVMRRIEAKLDCVPTRPEDRETPMPHKAVVPPGEGSSFKRFRTPLPFAAKQS